MGKRTFKYTDPNGIVQTDIELYNTAETQDYYNTLTLMQERFYAKQGKFAEKPWRNAELDLTDKLLQVDSTYNNELVSGSTLYDDILAYRAELRAYDYTSSDARPTRPDWYTG